MNKRMIWKKFLSELKKDQYKSFEDVIKSVKRKKQDDYEEETPDKKNSKPSKSMVDLDDIISDTQD
jgi:hypothetical protein